MSNPSFWLSQLQGLVLLIQKILSANEKFTKKNY